MSLGLSGLEGRDMVDIGQREEEAKALEREMRRRENGLTLLNPMGRVN